MSAAEAEIASALSLPELPTANAQIRAIEERMAAPYEREITVPPEVVDEILRTGGNRRGSQLRLIYNYMIEQTPEAATAFVKREYGKGGKGFTIYDEDWGFLSDEPAMTLEQFYTAMKEKERQTVREYEIYQLNAGGRDHLFIASYTTPAVPAWAALAARWVDTLPNDANLCAGHSTESCTSARLTICWKSDSATVS